MIKKLYLGLFLLLFLISSVLAISNPSAVFCEESNGKYVNLKMSDGSEKGYCEINGELIEGWKYYRENYNKMSEVKAMSFQMPEKKEYFKNRKIISDRAPLELTGKLNPNIDFKTEVMGIIKTAPSSFDWRNYSGQDWTTSVRNQLGCGSCWAFSSVGIVESKININLNNATFDNDLSEQDVITNNLGGANCSGGFEIDALNYIKDTGIVSESCMPYTASNSGTMCAEGITEKTKIGNYVQISPNLNAIKTAIATNGPITAYLLVLDTFNDYSNGIYNSSGAEYYEGLHSISIIGYNDAEEYWIVKNSWGTGWGEEGYIRISYSENDFNYDDGWYLENEEWYYDSSHGVFFLDDSYYVTTTDSDNDGINDGADNCQSISNANQSDQDSDGIGDVCDSICSSNLQNSSWSSWNDLISCRINNTLIQIRNLTQTDLHGCSLPLVFNETQEISCDFCSPFPTNTSWSDWFNITLPVCSTYDVIAQNRSRIEYDLNYSTCYNVTQLESDLWNNGENKTHIEYQNLSCDFCTPAWIKVEGTNYFWFNDSNNCYIQTNLSSDLLNRPASVQLNFTENKTFFLDNATEEKLLEINFNFSKYSENLSNLSILKEDNESIYAYTIIRGLNLSINETFQKIVYMNKVIDSGLICIKDAELENISEISIYCNSSNETLFTACPQTQGNYSCEVENERYKIRGLSYSGVKEQSAYCGDTICNNGETCSACPGDCGACPVLQSSGSGGGGGGGGGGASTKTTFLNKIQMMSEQKIVAGKGDIIIFELSNLKNHSLKVNSIKNVSVNLTISSEPINIQLVLGKDIKLNLTNSSTYELYLKLNNINITKAEIILKRINENIFLDVNESNFKENNQSKGINIKEKEYAPIIKKIVIGIVILVVLYLLGLWIYKIGKKHFKKKHKKRKKLNQLKIFLNN